MKRTLSLATALAFAVASCGDGGPTGPGGGNGNAMSATIDGTDITFPSTGVTGVYVNNVLQIGGTSTTNPVRQINIVLNNVTATGTIGLNPPAAPNQALLTIMINGQANVWTTALPPATGSLTLTTLTADRVAGTFPFTGQAGPGTPATGQKSVTSGTFDIDL
jgi:hypothetical protein